MSSALVTENHVTRNESVPLELAPGIVGLPIALYELPQIVTQPLSHLFMVEDAIRCLCSNEGIGKEGVDLLP